MLLHGLLTLSPFLPPARACFPLPDINRGVCSRLLQLSKGLQIMYRHYSTGGKSLNWAGFERFGLDFGIVPALCTSAQLRELFDVR